MTIAEASLAFAGLHAGVDAAASLLVQISPTFPDTLVTRTVAPEASVLDKVAEVLRALMTLAILSLTFAVVPAAWNFRKSYKKISDLLDRVYADINPLTHHASRIAENVDYVTTAIRADVQRASATLSDANARLQEAIQRTERRAREFEALLSVVQEEAETTFVAAASTVRGVRSGVGQLSDDLAEPALPPRRRRRARARLRELADEEEVVDVDPVIAGWGIAADAGAAEGDVPAGDAADVLGAVDVSGPRRGPGGSAEGADALDFVEDDTLEDFYDMGDTPDAEDDRRARESEERPRVRRRRDQRD